MEHRIFNCAIAVSMASFLPGAVFVLFQGQWQVGLGLLLCFAAYSYIYYLCRFADRLQWAVLMFAVVGGTLLNTMWIIDRGALGSTAFFVFVVMQIIIFTAEKPMRYVLAVIVNILLISLFEQPLRALISWQMPYDAAGQIATLIVAVVYMAVLAMLYRNLIHSRSQSKVNNIVEQLQQESGQMNRLADQLVQVGDVLSGSAQGQKSAVEQLLATTGQLSATADQNNHLATGSVDNLRDTESELEAGRESVSKLLAAMDEIRQSSTQIQNINNVVNEIAWQTNLLSLNAMIEASRAGEANGGFKVVALEVKKLAERSAEAAGNINTLLESNLQSVKNGVQWSAAMQERFDAVRASMQPLADAVHNMSEASSEQTQAIRQINSGLADIDKTVIQNEETAAKMAQTAAELHKNAQVLLQVVEVLQQEL